MKTVFILERYVPKTHFEELLNTFRDSLDKAPTEMRLKLASVYSEMEENLKKKILDCETESGIWQGAIGRLSFEALKNDSYFEWSRFPNDPWRVAEAQIEDEATCWLGYINKKHRVDLTTEILDFYKSNKEV